MADDSSRIGGSQVGLNAGDLLRQVLKPAQSGPVSPAKSNKATAAAFGPAGYRMLPADYPMDQLDHSARRGTYLDLLI